MSLKRSASGENYRLIAVDLDGTLLDSSGVPHVADVAALKKCAAEGIVVTIATGRLYSGTRSAAQTLGVRGLVARGAVIRAVRDGAVPARADPVRVEVGTVRVGRAGQVLGWTIDEARAKNDQMSKS